jgi:TRAP-type transport system periplasmic protein
MKIHIASTVCTVALLLAAPVAAQETFTMKAGIVVQNDPLHESIKLLKERVEARTNGRVKVDLYPSAQLGGIPQHVQGVLLGTIEVFTTPPAFFKGTDPRFGVTDAPGLFDSIEHGHRTFTDPEFRETYLNAGLAKGVKGISVWNYSPTSYASLTPIRRLDDFRGKKVRVLATPVELGIMKELGATGIPMDYAETLPALQNRTLDAQRSSIVVMGSSKHYTVTKFITIVQDTMIPCGAIASMAFLNKLPADLRQAVEQAGKDTEEPMLKIALDYDRRAEQLWKENGAEIIQLPPADKTEFMKRARAVGEQVLLGDPATKDLFETLKRVAEKHRKKA